MLRWSAKLHDHHGPAQKPGLFTRSGFVFDRPNSIRVGHVRMLDNLHDLYRSGPFCASQETAFRLHATFPAGQNCSAVAPIAATDRFESMFPKCDVEIAQRFGELSTRCRSGTRLSVSRVAVAHYRDAVLQLQLQRLPARQQSAACDRTTQHDSKFGHRFVAHG